MATRPRHRRGRKRPLSRERVLGAAFELAADGGLKALTMQNVGQRLGVQAMSLYRHVENKDDLLTGIVDLVVSEIERPAGGDWRAAIRQRALSARQVFTRYRWAIGLIESRPRPGPATLRHHDWVLGVLIDAGFSSVLAVRAYYVLNSYIYGSVLQEASLEFDSLEGQAEVGQAMLEQLRDHPTLVRVTTEFLESGAAYMADFEFGLDLILDSLERTRAGS